MTINKGKYAITILLIVLCGSCYSFFSSRVSLWNASEDKLLKNQFVEDFLRVTSKKESKNLLLNKKQKQKTFQKLSILNLEHWSFLGFLSDIEMVYIMPSDKYIDGDKSFRKFYNVKNKNITKYIVNQLNSLELFKYCTKLRVLGIIGFGEFNYDGMHEIKSLKELQIIGDNIWQNSDLIAEISFLDSIEYLNLQSSIDSFEVSSIKLVGTEKDTFIGNQNFYKGLDKYLMTRFAKEDTIIINHCFTPSQCNKLKKSHQWGRGLFLEPIKIIFDE